MLLTNLFLNITVSILVLKITSIPLIFLLVEFKSSVSGEDS